MLMLMRYPTLALLLLLARSARSEHTMEGSYSQVFIMPDNRYALALGSCADVVGVHTFKQASDSSWRSLNHIPLPVAASQLSAQLLKITSIQSDIVLLSLGSTGYVLQLNPEYFELVPSGFAALQAEGVEGWRVYNDTLVALRWDPRPIWGSMKLDYYTINSSTLDFTLEMSEPMPHGYGAAPPETAALGTEDRFIVRSGFADLFFARVPDVGQVLVTARGGFPTILDYVVQVPAKHLQLTHLAHNSKTNDAAINTMDDQVCLFRSSLYYATETYLSAPSEGRFGAQLAFEGDILAISFEPVCSNRTYLLLYHVNATSIVPLAFKQVHYTNGDWSHQGDVFYLTDSWIAIRGSTTSSAYALYSIANATSAGFDWATSGFIPTHSFAAIDTCAPLEIVLCTSPGDVTFTRKQRLAETGIHVISALQADTALSVPVILAVKGFKVRPVTCKASLNTVVFQLSSGKLVVCDTMLADCQEPEIPAMAYAINDDLLVYTYPDAVYYTRFRFAAAHKRLYYQHQHLSLASCKGC